MVVVKRVSAQLAFVLIALLAIATFASAETTSTRRHHSVPTKLSTTKSHHSTASRSTHRSSAHLSRTSVKSTGHSRHGKTRKVAKKSWKSQGQHGITTDRTRQIQEALIQQHYLDGEPSGVWDTQTQEACRKFQADNGWQSKVLPDSRALIKLGLGPDQKDVLNPETAVTSPYLPGGGEKASDAMAPNTASVPER